MPNYGLLTIPHHAVYNSYASQGGTGLGQLCQSKESGAMYRWAENGGTALAKAILCQSEVPADNHDNVTADVARAVGAREVSATLGATAALKDAYKEGHVLISDDAGEGYAYPVGGNEAADSAAVLTVRLASDVTVQVAITTSTTMSFLKNRYKDVIIHPSPPTALLVGVTPHAIDADEFFFAQVGGVAAILTDGTVVLFEDVVASDGTDGAVEPADAAIADGTPPTGHGEPHVGTVLSVSATAEYSAVDLKMV